MGYSLRNGISLCEVAGRLLLLDVDADRYFALGHSADRALSKLLKGAFLDECDESSVLGLLERGILVSAPGMDHDIAACAAPALPETSLLDGNAGSVSPVAIAKAITGVAVSVARVRRQSLRWNLTSAVARRGVNGPPDESKLQRVATAFDSAGRLMSIHNRCLAQSLAVMRAIAAKGGWAQLVLGVSLGPFAAHCWVQSGGVIINDRVDRVRYFTPILIV